MFAQGDEPAQPSAADMIGKPIPFIAMQKGYEHCLNLGLPQQTAHECTQAVASLLARNKPYDAMKSGLSHLDYSGTYRLMAVLLAEAARIAGQERT